jgi:hypothetical protein
MQLITVFIVIILIVSIVSASRASRRRARLEAKKNAQNIINYKCRYTMSLFDSHPNMCPLPPTLSYKTIYDQPYQIELWDFHQKVCMPKLKSNNFERCFYILFRIILYLYIVGALIVIIVKKR